MVKHTGDFGEYDSPPTVNWATSRGNCDYLIISIETGR